MASNNEAQLREQVKVLQSTIKNLKRSDRDQELESFRRNKMGETVAQEQQYREQLKMFGRNGDASFRVGEEPCTCGKHKGLEVTLKQNGKCIKTIGVCPITLWLFRTRQFLRESTGQAFLEWAELHPIKPYVKEA